MLSYDVAETCVFDKQSPGPGHCGLDCSRHPFSRSYGVILPSSLERVVSRPLVYSTNLPVSVYGTGYICAILVVRAFLGSRIARECMKCKHPIHGSRLSSRTFFFALSTHCTFPSISSIDSLRPPPSLGTPHM